MQHGLALRVEQEVRGQGIELHSLKHVSHVFHYVTTNCLTRAANNGNSKGNGNGNSNSNGNGQSCTETVVVAVRIPEPKLPFMPMQSLMQIFTRSRKIKVKAESMRVNSQRLLTAKSN